MHVSLLIAKQFTASLFHTIFRPDPEERNRKRLHLIAIAYASNIGGTGTITGTAPNIILLEKIQG